MYTSEQNSEPMINGMHIHPSLSEVVERAFRNLMPTDQYHHLIEHSYKLEVAPEKVEMESHTCTQCGRDISPGSTYCDRCGSKI